MHRMDSERLTVLPCRHEMTWSWLPYPLFDRWWWIGQPQMHIVGAPVA
ncbi:MAG TPA: hypothetical protein VFN57_11910 [Thermomicrobiaceae bacterium]|nr:hypothetical protein [Thermomicrobiaceae bacterium]